MRQLQMGLLLLLLGGVGEAMAFPGKITVVKDACWQGYDVKVKVLDGVTHHTLFTLDMPKGKEEAKIVGEVAPRQELRFTATYAPVFWESEKNKVYQGVRYIAAPAVLDPAEKEWAVTLCFAKDFKNIPLPPKVSGNCRCPNMQPAPSIPPIFK